MARCIIYLFNSNKFNESVTDYIYLNTPFGHLHLFGWFGPVPLSSLEALR